MEKSIWDKVLLISGGHFWLDYYVNYFAAILPLYVLLYGWSNKEIAIILAVQAMSTNFGQPIFGYIMDYCPGVGSLITSLLWVSVPLVLLSVTSNYHAVMLLAFMTGIGSAIYHPLGTLKVSEACVPDKKSFAVSVYSTAGSFGFSLSPLVVVYFVHRFGMEYLWITLLPALIWVYIMKKTRTQTISTVQPKPLSMSFLKNTTLLKMTVIVMLRSWSFYALTIFSPLLILSPTQAEKYSGTVQTVFLLAITVGTIIGGYISDKTNNYKLMLFLPLFLAGVVMQFMLLTNGLTAWILLAILGILIHFNLTKAIVLAQKIIPENAGLAMGLVMGFSFGSGSLMSTFTGWMADSFNLIFALRMTSISLFCSALLVFTLPSGIEDNIEVSVENSIKVNY